MQSGRIPAATSEAPSRTGARIVRAGAERLEGSRTALVKFLRGAPLEQFYPAGARALGLEGFVVVDLLINEAGLVVEAQVLDESPPDEGFALAALDLAKTYEFDNTLHRLVLMSLTVRFVP